LPPQPLAKAGPSYQISISDMTVKHDVAVRPAEASELDALARVWFDAWNDAHAAIVPAELTRRRTLPRFRDRLAGMLAEIRVAGMPGQPVGFCVTRDDELYQLFVSSEARGTGAAAALISDAEARLAARAVATAWLACAVGNDRAARFYEKNGWARVGSFVDRLETPEGEIRLEVWRYEKSLATPVP
jgi:ribosomal protein S18 acetylase RimI-like enzyme